MIFYGRLKELNNGIREYPSSVHCREKHSDVQRLLKVRKLTYKNCDPTPPPEDDIECGEKQPNESVRGKCISDTNASTPEGLDNTPINTLTRSAHLKLP